MNGYSFETPTADPFADAWAEELTRRHSINSAPREAEIVAELESVFMAEDILRALITDQQAADIPVRTKAQLLVEIANGLAAELLA